MWWLLLGAAADLSLLQLRRGCTPAMFSDLPETPKISQLSDWPGDCRLAENVCMRNGVLSGKDLQWFGKQKVMSGMPGGTNRLTRPVRVERGRMPKQLLNVTPVLVYPDWPFSAETGPSFMLNWVNFVSSRPELATTPVIVALPQGNELPESWKLLRLAAGE
jgi:hypothetical protein